MQRLLARLDRFAASRRREYWIGLAIMFAALSGYQVAALKYASAWPGELALYTWLLFLSVALLASTNTVRVGFFVASVVVFTVWAAMFLTLFVR